jgi:hypothetical protein
MVTKDKRVRTRIASLYDPIQSDTIQYNPIQSSAIQPMSRSKTVVSLAVSLDVVFLILPIQQDQRSELHASAAPGAWTEVLQYCPLQYFG